MPLEPLQYTLPPEPGTNVWRYLTPTKYQDLLQRKALFFPKVARLREDDPLEGSVPEREVQYRQQAAYRDFKFPLIGTKEYERMTFNEKGTQQYHQEFYPQVTLASCWHMRDHESKPMWDRYAHENKSVAIRTTISCLVKAFKANASHLDYAQVRYLDLSTDSWYHPSHYTIAAYNFMIPNITKTREYEDERELRLLHRLDSWDYRPFWASQESPNGLWFDVNLNELISEVVLAPGTSAQEADTIHGMHTAAQVYPHLRPSTLDRIPLY